MNARQAKKIQSYPIPDPARKPSAQSPYTDAQIVRASVVMRRSYERGMRAQPTTPRASAWLKWAPAPRGPRPALRA